MEVSVSKLDNYTAVVIDGKLIEGVEDYKIASSADGTTELTIHIKLNANIAKYDLQATPNSTHNRTGYP